MPAILSELRIQDFRLPFLRERGCRHFHPRAETRHEQGATGPGKPAILLSQRSRDHSKSPRAHQFLPLGTCHMHAKPGAFPTRLRSHVQQEGGLLQSSRTSNQSPSPPLPHSTAPGSGWLRQAAGQRAELAHPGKKRSTRACTVFAYTMPEEQEFTTDNLNVKLLKLDYRCPRYWKSQARIF